MTDFLESVLSSMSSAFNSSPTPADGASVIDLNLNDDKTLKWRTLYNNSNAKKSSANNNNNNNNIQQHQSQQQQQQQQQQQEKLNIINRENKMSQGQDNIFNSSETNTKNHHHHQHNQQNQQQNHHNQQQQQQQQEYDNNDKVKVNATNMNKKNFNENIKININNNKKTTKNKITTRRRKNLQNKIKKPIENSISASRRTRRSNQLEIATKNVDDKKMTAVVVSTPPPPPPSSVTTETVNVEIEEKLPKRRGRSKKITDNQDNNSPKKQQNVTTKNQNSIDDIKTVTTNKITETITKTFQEINSNKNLQINSTLNNEQSSSGRQLSPSGRKLRRSERNSIPDEIKIEENDLAIAIVPLKPIKILNDSNLDGTGTEIETTIEPKGKRIRRSERLESRYEFEEIVNKIQNTPPVFQETVEIKEEPKRSPEVEIPTLNDSESEKKQNQQTTKPTISTIETTPKRRGRRSKTITPDKSVINPTDINPVVVINKRSRNLKEIGDTISTTPVVPKKEKTTEILPLAPPIVPAPISQRPLRRIKPTVKILENEELRYEFETKNIARMTACTDIVSTTPATTSTITPLITSSTTPADVEMMSTVNSGTKVKKEETSPKDIQLKQTPSPSTSKDPSPRPLAQSSTLPANEEIKRKLFPPIENSFNVDNIYPVQNQKPCPDPQILLNEIKAAKINLFKSPENKKLNRKQHRKLLKQKEKHFEKLGLRKIIKDDRTETEDSSDDNEEFLPPKKLNVGKPNVTLRLRNKENSPVSSVPKLNQQKTQKKRINSRLSSSSGGNGSGGNGGGDGGGNKLSSQIPTVTEQQLPPPPPASSGSSLRKDIKKEQSMICLCQKPSQYYTRNTPETAFCCAIDSIEDEKVGCCNQLNGELLNLLRPSHRVGYMILCDDHKKRLLAHNCCASCGIFCTQGKFILCKQEHFFHAECAQKYILNTPYDPTNTITTYPSPILVLKCPHCGCDTPEKTSLVTMKCNSLPVFLPSQRALIKPAKMSVPEGELTDGRTRRRFPSVVEMDKLIPESVMNIASQRQVTGGGSNSNSVNGNAVNDGDSEFTSRDMFYAINNDDLERVAEIIASGYDITSKMPEFLNGTCLHLVAHFGTVQMAYLLLCRDSSEYFLNMIDKELRTPSMCSIIGDKCDILKLFIQFGADLSLKGSDGMTCLHMAAKLGSIAAAQLIVESYKNCSTIINFKKFINAQDDGGWTPMVWAAENGFTDIVSYLISHGADPNVCDTENNTVLHWATLSNRIETIMILLQANINCNQQNINGDTALHIACRQSSTRVCLMLIANGSDLMIKNKACELPYDCIPNEESQCARAVGFNMQMRSFGATGLRNKVVCSDISNGRETHPIQAVRCDKIIKSKNSNIEHDDDIILPDFKYITKNILLQNSIQIDQRVSQMRICSCNDGCNTDQCQCSTISVQNWYTPEGRLNSEFSFDDPPMIFECNDVCGCNKLICKNRVVQNGIKIPLQIFECEQRLKGWGVRSLIQIPRGTFVSEYTGEILTDLEADRRTDDSYFFDLGSSDHCIDANYYGNISRFYNHSCSPNIVPVRVYYDHQDYRFPKIAFFACKDIMAGEEISFDYGDKFWAVKKKYFSCQCKSEICRYNSNSNLNTNTNNISNNISNNSATDIPVTG